jgi:hypothetical protein
MFPPIETQQTETEKPWAQKPRDRRALSAYRHGLTGQIILLTEADRIAYEKHCQGYHQSLAPRGPVEIDLVQAVANDRWRLTHAASLESSIFADGITQPDEVTSGNAEVDTVLAQGRVWISKGGNLQLLGLYESRIQRRFEKNMERYEPSRPIVRPLWNKPSKKPTSFANSRKAKAKRPILRNLLRSPDLIFQAPTSPVWLCAAAPSARPESSSRTPASRRKSPRKWRRRGNSWSRLRILEA